MSAPGHALRQAEHLGYGMLAAQANDALTKTLKGEALVPEEQRSLERASQFLRDVSSGARLVSTGVAGGNAAASVRALDYSMDPIAALQWFIKEQEVHDVLDHMADRVDRVGAAPLATTADREWLEATVRFFDEMHRSLMHSMERTRRSGATFGLPVSLNSL